MRLVKVIGGLVLTTSVVIPSVLVGVICGFSYYSFKWGVAISKEAIGQALGLAIQKALSKVKV